VSTRKRRFGPLSVLPPQYRLAVVLFVGVFYIFINDITFAACLFVVGMLVFLLETRKSYGFLASVFVSAGTFVLYNAVLSPKEGGGLSWWVFTINSLGIERGVVTGLRFAGTMLISISWLKVTSIPEMYDSLSFIKPIEPWLLGILRGIQILSREFVALTQSLIIRGVKWNSMVSKIKNLAPLLTVIIPRILENSKMSAVAQVSHQRVNTDRTVGSIVVNGLTVWGDSDDPPVLEDVSFQVHPGELVYLAGRSGSGRGPLLKAISGVIPGIEGYIQGEVFLSGLNTSTTDLAVLLSTGRYIGPNPFSNLYGLTVGQELAFMTESYEEGVEIAERMGLGSLWKEETTKLSGGQQVRLALAGALVSKVPVLLLNSPLQELDPQGRVDFLYALKEVLREGTTVVIADPLWEEIKPLKPRVLYLEDGRVQKPPKNWEKLVGVRKPFRFDRVPREKVVARMDGVHVSLSGNHILRGVSLEVAGGELVVIVGPNGSGKTTAMLTLAGAIQQQRGEVQVSGQAGFVFQNPFLQFARETVEAELGFGPRILAWSEKEANDHIAWGLYWTKLNPETSPIDLHPSNARMLAFAASETRTTLMILDEPTVGLDGFDVAKLVSLINKLRSRGVAVIVISHEEALAQAADRVLVFGEGRVVQER